jgi:hypothetical protein
VNPGRNAYAPTPTTTPTTIMSDPESKAAAELIKSHQGCYVPTFDETSSIDHMMGQVHHLKEWDGLDEREIRGWDDILTKCKSHEEKVNTWWRGLLSGIDRSAPGWFDSEEWKKLSAQRQEYEKPFKMIMVGYLNGYYQGKVRESKAKSIRMKQMQTITRPAIIRGEISLANVLASDAIFLKDFKKEVNMRYDDAWKEVLNVSLTRMIGSQCTTEKYKEFHPAVIEAIAKCCFGKGDKEHKGDNSLKLYELINGYFCDYRLGQVTLAQLPTGVTPVMVLDACLVAIFEIADDSTFPTHMVGRDIFTIIQIVLSMKASESLEKIKIRVLQHVASLFFQHEKSATWSRVLKSKTFGLDLERLLFACLTAPEAKRRGRPLLREAKAKFILDLRYSLPSSDIKTLLIRRKILGNGGKVYKPHMECFDDVFCVVGSMGDVGHQSSMNKITHANRQCRCYCECATCWDKVCYNYAVEMEEVKSLAKLFNQKLLFN